MIILGIETSCDETAASIVRGTNEEVEVLSNVVSSQIEIHKKYGGVIPEVAAREHVGVILPVVEEALLSAGLQTPAPAFGHPSKEGNFNHPLAPSLKMRGENFIDAIAVSTGPGLVTSLISGVETAKTLGYAWNIPVVAVNHIEGHIYANFIRESTKSQVPNHKQISNTKFQKNANPKKEFPAIVLTVSGGHTMLVLMKAHGDLKIIGDTRDDAAGEAFDKAAQLMRLGYPGGPAIAKEAMKFQITNYKLQIKSKNKTSNQTHPTLAGTPLKGGIKLPRPMINSKDFDFSFSGLKTALLYELKKDKNWKNRIPEYAFEFQQAVIDVLIHKTLKAAEKHQAKTVMLAGGVSANTELRNQLEKAVKEHKTNYLPTPSASQPPLPRGELNFCMPNLKYTTDNAAMVASAGYFKAKQKKPTRSSLGGGFTPWSKLKADPNLSL